MASKESFKNTNGDYFLDLRKTNLQYKSTF